nr:hypothetical protein CFP56_56488 [Quercus suber]
MTEVRSRSKHKRSGKEREREHEGQVRRMDAGRRPWPTTANDQRLPRLDATSAEHIRPADVAGIDGGPSAPRDHARKLPHRASSRHHAIWNALRTIFHAHHPPSGAAIRTTTGGRRADRRGFSMIDRFATRAGGPPPHLWSNTAQARQRRRRNVRKVGTAAALALHINRRPILAGYVATVQTPCGVWASTPDLALPYSQPNNRPICDASSRIALTI